MTSKLTIIVANFDTQLSTKLTVGSSSGYLKSVTDKEGNVMPAGRYCMVFDGGSGNEEHLVFTLDTNPASPTYKQMTNIQNISRQGVLTSNNKIEHRVGISVRLTDYANLLYFYNLLKGVDNLDGSTPLGYDTDPTSTLGADPTKIATVGYANTKASLAGTNNFLGQNTFNSSPHVPNATAADAPVSYAQLLAATLVGLQAGLDYCDVNYSADGKVASVHDNLAGKTYVFTYDLNGFLNTIYDGVKKWTVNISEGKITKLTQ
jgi:hypothetical protein